MALLEICCYSVECAVTAQKHGADRIELCAAPKEGGLTPSYGVLKSARREVTIPVHPIIRPRGGDFCYTADEFAAMLEDIAAVRDLGFPGWSSACSMKTAMSIFPACVRLWMRQREWRSLFIVRLICVKTLCKRLKRLQNWAWRAS